MRHTCYSAMNNRVVFGERRRFQTGQKRSLFRRVKCPRNPKLEATCPLGRDLRSARTLVERVNQMFDNNYNHNRNSIPTIYRPVWRWNTIRNRTHPTKLSLLSFESVYPWKMVSLIYPLDCRRPQKAFGQRDDPDFRTECSKLSRLTKFPNTDYTGIYFHFRLHTWLHCSICCWYFSSCFHSSTCALMALVLILGNATNIVT